MTRTVADQMVETLAAAGVERIYGIVGDSLNGFTDALRRHGGMQWLHVRHEEVAAFGGGAPGSNNPGGNGAAGTGNPSRNAVGLPGNPTNASPGITNATTTGGVIGGGVGAPSAPQPTGGISPSALAKQPASGQGPTASNEVQGVAEEAPLSPTGLSRPGPDGVSTVIVAARPCGVAAHETDGTTTCIGIPGPVRRGGHSHEGTTTGMSRR
jgi:hypothetical protein